MNIPVKLPREDKERIAHSVIAYFEQERSESIGQLGAEQLVEFMLKELAPYVYNKAISDARLLLNEKLSQIEDELYAMEKR